MAKSTDSHEQDLYIISNLNSLKIGIPRQDWDNNARCDGCDQPIRHIGGTQCFKCLDCPDFDLCSRCYPLVSHDQSHRFEQPLRSEIHRLVSYQFVGTLEYGRFHHLLACRLHN